MTKIHFTQEEDQFILSFLTNSGENLDEKKKKWKVLAKIFKDQFPGSNKKGKALHAHFNNSLNPKLNRGHFTNEEDHILLQYIEKFGTQYRKIAMLMERPENMIKNRFIHHIQKNPSDEKIKKIKNMSKDAKKKKISEEKKINKISEEEKINKISEKEKFDMKVLFDLLHEDFIDWGMKIV
jgi:hypothetical protein